MINLSSHVIIMLRGKVIQLCSTLCKVKITHLCLTFCNPMDSWVGRFHWRRDRLPTPVFLGFPCGSTGKESSCNAGDVGSIRGLRISPREGNGYPLQYYGLENSMDYTVHVATKSQT